MLESISSQEALEVLNIETENTFNDTLKKIKVVRERSNGDKVESCSIINARCGGCSEDCAFCAQSKRSNAVIDYYSLLDAGEIYRYAEAMDKKGINRIGIVTSGRGVEFGSKELDEICRALEKITSELQISPCASLGLLDKNALKLLQSAGLRRYHNNLETAESFFSKICTTRSYWEQLATINAAKELGLEICCGGIFGLGETKEQRIEMLNAICELDVDSVPLNFFTPISGTPLEEVCELTPFECLKIIAAATLMMPEKVIRVCGGREYNLKGEQSRIFSAGAGAFMTGGYLVTSGRSAEEDLEMLEKLGLTLEERGD